MWKQRLIQISNAYNIRYDDDMLDSFSDWLQSSNYAMRSHNLSIFMENKSNSAIIDMAVALTKYSDLYYSNPMPQGWLTIKQVADLCYDNNITFANLHDHINMTKSASHEQLFDVFNCFQVDIKDGLVSLKIAKRENGKAVLVNTVTYNSAKTKWLSRYVPIGAEYLASHMLFSQQRDKVISYFRRGGEQSYLDRDKYLQLARKYGDKFAKALYFNIVKYKSNGEANWQQLPYSLLDKKVDANATLNGLLRYLKAKDRIETMINGSGIMALSYAQSVPQGENIARHLAFDITIGDMGGYLFAQDYVGKDKPSAIAVPDNQLIEDVKTLAKYGGNSETLQRSKQLHREIADDITRDRLLQIAAYRQQLWNISEIATRARYDYDYLNGDDVAKIVDTGLAVNKLTTQSLLSALHTVSTPTYNNVAAALGTDFSSKFSPELFSDLAKRGHIRQVDLEDGERVFLFSLMSMTSDDQHENKVYVLAKANGISVQFELHDISYDGLNPDNGNKVHNNFWAEYAFCLASSHLEGDLINNPDDGEWNYQEIEEVNNWLSKYGSQATSIEQLANSFIEHGGYVGGNVMWKQLDNITKARGQLTQTLRWLGNKFLVGDIDTAWDKFNSWMSAHYSRNWLQRVEDFCSQANYESAPLKIQMFMRLVANMSEKEGPNIFSDTMKMHSYIHKAIKKLEAKGNNEAKLDFINTEMSKLPVIKIAHGNTLINYNRLVEHHDTLATLHRRIKHLNEVDLADRLSLLCENDIVDNTFIKIASDIKPAIDDYQQLITIKLSTKSRREIVDDLNTWLLQRGHHELLIGNNELSLKSRYDYIQTMLNALDKVDINGLKVLTTKHELLSEGDDQDHCIASYDDYVADGEGLIVSWYEPTLFSDEKNKRITIELRHDEINNRWDIGQARGRFNKNYIDHEALAQLKDVIIEVNKRLGRSL